MLYYQFKNYEEFKSIFGIQQHGNGVKSRRNNLLLGFIKDKKLLREAIETNDFSLLHISSVAELKEILMNKIQKSGSQITDTTTYDLYLLGRHFYSPLYSTDELKGICEDGTPNMVRYVNHEKDHVFMMKAGRMMKHIIESCDFGKTLSKTIKNWLCEEFTTDWEANVIGSLPKNKLFVNDNFAAIYDREKMLRDNEYDTDPFHSCMTNKGFHVFYKNAVKAKAAYLQNEDGKIIARCIIFTEVFDEDDKVWRYAERAYSYHVNLVYQRALIDALIKGGYIDCFKKIGAGCSEANSILDIYGNSLSNKQFRINCELDWGEPLSYQDSFKWYSLYSNTAYNFEPDCDYEALDTTNGQLEDGDEDDDDDQNYDSYHDNYTYEDVVSVFYRGESHTCAEDDLDDFRIYRGDYYHEDDFMDCPYCGELMLNPEYYDEENDLSFYQSELTGKSYCSEECKEKAEEEYKEKNWHYAEYDDVYFENEDDITYYNMYDSIAGRYIPTSISKAALSLALDKQYLTEIDGAVYDVIDISTGRPYGMNAEKVTVTENVEAYA